MKRFLPYFIIAAVALLTIGIATTSYRSKTRPLPKPAATPKVATLATATGTPQAGEEKKEKGDLHIRGPRNSVVTMEVYGDFQCPACGLASRAIDELQKQYSNDMRVIFYQFPLAMHNHAMEAGMAAEAAGVQGKFWEMHDLLYQYQAVWSKVSDVSQFFESYAESIGLDVARFNADRQSPDIRQRVMSQGEAGAARGVKNTPTIFLNGDEVRAGFTRDSLQQAIEAARTPKPGS